MGKILIVDDMMVSLMIVENILASKYETATASSGKEAMEVYREIRPDMVLSDFRMPGMTGFELQRALEKEYRTPIPFMFMTADETEETENQGFENGAADFIRKPINQDLLLRRVDNIMQNIEHIQGLKKNATIDRLTGLLNKAASQEAMKNACNESRGALMMLDLDSFKLVNDIYGHDMGDKVLIAFSDIVRSAMRPNDLIGRVGGDEFMAFCYGMLDEAGIANKSQFINERLVYSAKMLMGEDMNIPLGASIGCVFVPQEGVDYAELCKKADKALYTVKQNGKHGYSVFSREKQQQEEKPALDGIGRVEMILSERNQAGGALMLSLDGFRAVYRFLRRTMEIYAKPECILLFTLSVGNAPKVPPADAGEQFFEVLRMTLRKGDAVAKNGNHQFLALLSNMEMADPQHVIERIRKAWEEKSVSDGFTLSYEWSIMEP